MLAVPVNEQYKVPGQFGDCRTHLGDLALCCLHRGITLLHSLLQLRDGQLQARCAGGAGLGCLSRVSHRALQLLDLVESQAGDNLGA